MSATGPGTCGYCQERKTELFRLNSSELMEMMHEYNRAFTRRTGFCRVCMDKMNLKFRARKQRERLKQRRAQSSIDDRTTSYSNASNAALSASSSSQRNRSSSQAGGSGGRNVAKRSGGPPSNRTSAGTSRQPNPDPESDSESEMYVDIPDTSTDRNSQQQQGSTSSSPRRSSTRRSNQSQTSRRSNRSQTSNVDYGNGDDYPDDNDGNDNDANRTDGGGSVSSQAPMPSNRTQRSSNAAYLSTSQLANQSSSERSASMRNYKRPSGG